jgi:hypothetical protein
LLLILLLLLFVKNFSFPKGNKHCGRLIILPIQSRIIVSNSVPDGLDAHEKPTVPRPAERSSPIIDG